MLEFIDMRVGRACASTLAATLVGAFARTGDGAARTESEARVRGAARGGIAAVAEAELQREQARRGELGAPGETGWADQLLVFDFLSEGDDKGEDCAALGMALAQGIRERLFELSGVNVLGFTTTGSISGDRDAGEPGERGLESARRAHCRWVVMGRASRAGDGYSLAWALHQTAHAPSVLREERIAFAGAQACVVESQVTEAVLQAVDGVRVGGAQVEQAHLQLPTEAYLEYGRGLLQLRDGTSSEVTRLFEQLREAHPRQLRVLHGLLLSLASGAEGKARTTLAEGIIDPVLEWRRLCRDAPALHGQRSEEAEALYTRGMQLDSEEEEEEAAALYDCSLSLSSHYADARFGAWATRANARRYSRAAEDLLRGLRLAPDSAAARLAIGLCLAIADRAADARAEFESALALELPPRERARIEEALANLDMQAGDVEKARQHVQRGLALVPDDPSLLSRAGMVALMEGRISDARALLGRATSLAPKMVDAWVALGTCALIERDVDGAIEILAAAREISPDQPIIYENLARAYDAKGMAVEAVEVRRRAVDLREGELDAGVEVALRGDGESVVESRIVTPERSRLAGEIELAVGLLCSRDAVGAMEILRAAQEREAEPRDPLLQAITGVALLVLGDPDQARALLADVAALDEESAETMRRLGLALYRNDSLSGAIAALEVVARSPLAEPAVDALLEDAREQRQLSEDRSGWVLVPGALSFVDGMCLPSSIGMAMARWAGEESKPFDLADVKRKIMARVRDPRRIGSVAGFLIAEDWFVVLCQSSLEGLERFVDQGYPVVALLKLESTDDAGHACLVIGYDRARRLIITHDPNQKAFFTVAYDQFEKQWGWSKGPAWGRRMALLVCPFRKATEELMSLAGSSLWRATRVNALLELGRREEALAELRLAQEPGPEDGYVAHELVLAYLELERWEEARHAALEAIELSPSTQCLYRHLQQAYLSEGLAVEAVERAQGWLGEPVRGPGPALLKATALSALGRLGEAGAVLDEAARSHPDSPAPHFYLARLRVTAGDFAGAVDPARAAVRLDPSESSHHATLVMAHVRLGETEQAMSAIDAWIDAVPDEAAPFLARANLLAKERPEEAAAALERALEREPENADALANLGVLCLMRGEHQAAIRHLERALELDPECQNGSEMLGIAYLKTGRIDDALAALRRAVDLNPRSAQAFKLLGVVLSMKGRGEESVAALREAFELAPGDPELRRMLEQASSGSAAR